MGSSQSASTTTGGGYNAYTEADTVAKDFSSQCKNKHIIVTGANTGLGLETARVLAQNGAEIILCSRDAKNGEEAAKKIRG